MKKSLIAIILFCLAFIPAMKAQSYEELLQKDWAHFGAYADDNLNVSKPVKAAIMGDSIFWGWEQQNPAFFKEHGLVCRAIPGETSSEMLCRFMQDIIGLNPEYVFIMSGTNDFAMNNGYIRLENVFGNIKSMCELALFNGIKIRLVSVPPCSGYAWRPQINPAEQIIKINGLLKAYAESTDGIEYVDFFSAVVNSENGFAKNLSEDGCHPNGAGYKLWEPILIKALN